MRSRPQKAVQPETPTATSLAANLSRAGFQFGVRRGEFGRPKGNRVTQIMITLAHCVKCRHRLQTNMLSVPLALNSLTILA